MKVLTIVGTRPEIIKLSRVICELDKFVDHVLVHTGQNYDYELNEIFFKDLEIRKPDYFLNSVGDSLAQTIGNIITNIDGVLLKEQPDAIVLLGDTNSCLSAIAAKRRKIPIFHLEAGNRCFDQRVPEEINRKIVDHLSDINLVYTEHARRYLLDEGFKPEMIIKTGSPMKEVLSYYRKQIDNSNVLIDLKLNKNEYFIVSSHREENVDNEVNFLNFLNSLNAIAIKFGKPVIVSTHPRTRKRLNEVKDLSLNENIKFLNPLGFFDYIKIQQNSACVISDSGTITEESSILNFPAVTIRQAHERPEGMDVGTLVMCGLESDKVINAINLVTSQHKENADNIKLVEDYNVDSVSTKVLRIIYSYTDYVNKKVWFKS
ncbi:UDP-N-acetylglucosamine 2-epimerase (non-hydrolyzing) [Flavobacterium sp. ZB4P23]|uniref:non-hydrolyzing UDP-N-acetylglucosamine 2-epimerase n=1 Tax=unclassified Flavobacterium TaxID=196869 RepID=UPI000F8351E6|nr:MULTISPECIES: UDP-N-acetylglucosamine 2-epimerase (non-hydrolyzing) [unclassified Flavobacterium]RTY83743.1 UDP-N-acetylglucosamine 2-epimerase (non-hydrolyzing) [Flavobacterium sp. ZB4P23]RTZ06727.1 UDP-N-acetylglucosamine 2-epimerase (non-hydrolyzing) [Flavobacterium sp. GSP6]